MLDTFLCCISSVILYTVMRMKITIIIHLIAAVILILSILGQQSNANIDGALGGGAVDSQSVVHTRRGFEKFLFYVTITSGIVFAISALLVFVI